MKAKRYMKPPSCRKPATVTVPYAGPALDGQRPTRTISEPRILSVNPGPSWKNFYMRGIARSSWAFGLSSL